MRILFVCKHNRFRSKVAEAYLKKINKNKRIQVVSAGVFKGNPISNNVISIGKKLGINIIHKTQGLKSKGMNRIDLLIIVADDVPVSLFKGKVKNIIVWKINDTSETNKIRIEKTMKEIFKKVDSLNKDIEGGKIKWKR